MARRPFSYAGRWFEGTILSLLVVGIYLEVQVSNIRLREEDVKAHGSSLSFKSAPGLSQAADLGAERVGVPPPHQGLPLPCALIHSIDDLEPLLSEVSQETPCLCCEEAVRDFTGCLVPRP